VGDLRLPGPLSIKCVGVILEEEQRDDSLPESFSGVTDIGQSEKVEEQRGGGDCEGEAASEISDCDADDEAEEDCSAKAAMMVKSRPPLLPDVASDLTCLFADCGVR
jgi:hypothetical protein